MIEIITDETDLSRKVWTFNVIDRYSAGLDVRLVRYEEHERPSKRHKTRAVRVWHSASHWCRSGGSVARSVDKPKIPDHVRAAVVAKIVDMIKFVDE